MNKNTTVEIVSGPWKNDPTKTWEALKITIGDWSTLHFFKTTYELQHVKQLLEEK